MSALLKENVIAEILSNPRLVNSIERYDLSAAPIVLHGTERRQAPGQSWASHMMLTKSDVNALLPFSVVGVRQNLGGTAGFNSMEYWSVSFGNLEAAVDALCQASAIDAVYLDEIRYDVTKGQFKHEPDQGRLDYEAALIVANARKPEMYMRIPRPPQNHFSRPLIELSRQAGDVYAMSM